MNETHINKRDELILEYFKDRYTVTKDGRVFSNYFKNRSTLKKLKVPRELKPATHKNGYKRVGIAGSLYSIHRIMAVVFLGLPEKFMVAGHINDIKSDNRVENLKWMSMSENSKNAILNNKFGIGSENGNSKLTQQDITSIWQLRNKKTPVAEIAKKFNVSQSTVFYILSGKTYKRESRLAKKIINQAMES
jgi:hypothetical protein